MAVPEVRTNRKSKVEAEIRFLFDFPSFIFIFFLSNLKV